MGYSYPSCLVGMLFGGNRLEINLRAMQVVLEKINYKVDLVFYTNFLAAMDLAANAFTMDDQENRRNSALQAINRFLEAEHVYTNLFDNDYEQCSQIIPSYLSTLSLAYVAEARCYLELEEHKTAIRRFQEGKSILRSCVQKYINFILTTNPAIYLQPELKGVVDLQRLTEIYRWTDPSLNENDIFELQRENFVQFAKHPNKYINSIPKSMLANIKDKKDFSQYLPNFLERVESMIETHQRFESYETEVKAISELGMTFRKWQELTPSEPALEGDGIMLIIPSMPIAVYVTG